MNPILEGYRRRYTRRAYVAAAVLCVATWYQAHALVLFVLQTTWVWAVATRGAWWWQVERRL